MNSPLDVNIMRLSFLRSIRSQIAIDRDEAIAAGRTDESDLLNAAEDDILEAVGSMVALCDHLKKLEGK